MCIKLSALGFCVDKYWPDFNENDIEESIHIFQKRHRKFGAN